MRLVKWTRGVRDLFAGERERSISVVGERAYVEYRGVDASALPAFLAELRARIEGHAQLSEVHLNPFTRRVVFRVQSSGSSRASLTAIVTSAERVVLANPHALGLDQERSLPDDLSLDREYSLEALADALALVSSVVLRVLPFVPRSLGTNLYGLLFLVAQVESLRQPLDERFGKERTDFLLHLAMASAQGVAQRPLSSLVALGEKLASLRELRERRALWNRWADQLVRKDGSEELGAPLERPQQLPQGPIERHADRAWQVALGSFGVSLVTTRSPSRAVAAGFAALPTPARLGRELFVAEVGRVFARHGMLALSKDALRRLDRVDCLVIPAELVAREQFLIGDAFALRGLSREEALSEARRLFSSDRPLRVKSGHDYTLGPARLVQQLDDVTMAAMAEREARGVLVLALSRDDQVMALIEVQIFPERGVADALSAARKLGLLIVVAADSSDAAESVHPDDIVGYSVGLVEGIQRLQREGRTVCFFGRGPSPGYAAADLGIALCARDQATPWGAHLLCPDDTHSLSMLVEAMAVARTVSAQSVRLSMGAAAFGTLASTSGSSLSAANVARRVMFVVNAASVAAMIDAVRRTALVERSTRPLVDPTPWHALSPEGVLARLGSSEHGLARVDPTKPVRSRLPTATWLELGRAVQKELMSPLSPLLALGAGVSAMVGSMADAGIVAGVGGINALIGGYQRFKTERAITQLVRVADARVHVKREGIVTTCGVSELRRGDVVVLGQGDVVPADCRILTAESLEVDTSTLTGESLPVQKSAAPSYAEGLSDVASMLYAGTSVAAGRATAVVVATGEDTVAQRAVLQMPDESRGGVEGRLRELMRLTGPVALSAGAALVAAGLLRGRRVDDLVSTGVGLAVAAVPEGLPVLATAAQLAAAERLSRHGALVKNPRAIEAVGRVDVLCMDKTGTLTEGHIELCSLHDGETEEPLHGLSGERREVLRSLAAAVSHARGIAVDPMDAAIVRAARAVLGSDYAAGQERLAERAFESSRGFEAVLLRSEDGARMVVKGAPEQLLARASHIARGARPPQPTSEEGARLTATIEQLAKRGLRVIAVADRKVSAEELKERSAQELLSDPQPLCLHGFVAFRDPARASARPAIAGLSRAGVRVVMITGDHASTAHAIAHEVGLPGAGNVLAGPQIAQLSEAELEQAAVTTSVFARVTPAQKVRVVRALQRAGHVVGMVGDGANDAPAMRIADAGIAVGRDCTEAARGASDLVLADARIDSLVDVVVEGRAMWTAVRDAVSILVGGNLGEIGFTVAVGALTGSSPLTPRQLLLVNFLTDIAPSMAIALRPPSVRDLAVLREATPQAALGQALDREIVSRAIATGMGAGSAWLGARLTGGKVRARTVGLVGLVGSQLGQTLLRGGNSRSVVWTSVGSFAALGIIVQTPGLSQLFGCRPLGPIAWGTGLMSSAGVTLLSPVIDRVVDEVADLSEVVRAKLDQMAHAPETGRAEQAVRALTTAGLRALRG